jgi:hypothetical protein
VIGRRVFCIRISSWSEGFSDLIDKLEKTFTSAVMRRPQLFIKKFFVNRAPASQRIGDQLKIRRSIENPLSSAVAGTAMDFLISL